MRKVNYKEINISGIIYTVGENGYPKVRNGDTFYLRGEFYKCSKRIDDTVYYKSGTEILEVESKKCKKLISSKSKWMSYKEARKVVRSMSFKSIEQFRQWDKLNKKPSDIPSNPANSYKKDGWKGWGDFLGII